MPSTFPAGTLATQATSMPSLWKPISPDKPFEDCVNAISHQICKTFRCQELPTGLKDQIVSAVALYGSSLSMASHASEPILTVLGTDGPLSLQEKPEPKEFTGAKVTLASHSMGTINVFPCRDCGKPVCECP